jgi:hypothetical protein
MNLLTVHIVTVFMINAPPPNQWKTAKQPLWAMPQTRATPKRSLRGAMLHALINNALL